MAIGNLQSQALCMTSLSHIVRDYHDTGAMNALINIFGFVDDYVFVTKGGLSLIAPTEGDNTSAKIPTAWYRLRADGPTPLDAAADPNLSLQLV